MSDKPTTAELITMLSEFNCHTDIQKLAADRLEAAEATIKAAGELADKWENDETLGRERDGIICADQLRKLLRSKDNG